MYCLPLAIGHCVVCRKVFAINFAHKLSSKQCCGVSERKNKQKLYIYICVLCAVWREVKLHMQDKLSEQFKIILKVIQAVCRPYSFEYIDISCKDTLGVLQCCNAAQCENGISAVHMWVCNHRAHDQWLVGWLVGFVPIFTV